jgi:hypothetical protein
MAVQGGTPMQNTMTPQQLAQNMAASFQGGAPTQAGSQMAIQGGTPMQGGQMPTGNAPAGNRSQSSMMMQIGAPMQGGQTPTQAGSQMAAQAGPSQGGLMGNYSSQISPGSIPAGGIPSFSSTISGGGTQANAQMPAQAAGQATAQGGAPQPAAPAQPNVFQQSATGLTNAMGGAQAAMGYTPQQVAASNVSAERVGTTFGYTPKDVAAQAALGGINQYINPYTQNVIDTSMADLERQRMMQQNQLGAQASAAGAFGGSRQGIAEAETNRAFAQQGGQLAAQLRQQGFQTALGASQQDVANQLQAALANQGAFARSQEFGQATGLQAQGMNQSAALQAAMANQSTGLQAGIANQGAGLNAANLRLSGAGQLGNLANMGFNMGRTTVQDQAAQGLLGQQTNQALIDAVRGQYGGFTGAPTAALNTQLAGVSGANMGQNTTTQTSKPGLFDFLAAGASVLPKICWVAREVYGPEDDRWQQFRAWMFGAAPDWLFDAYSKHGEAFAGVVRKVPALKRVLRPLMDRARRSAGFEV